MRRVWTKCHIAYCQESVKLIYLKLLIISMKKVDDAPLRTYSLRESISPDRSGPHELPTHQPIRSERVPPILIVLFITILLLLLMLLFFTQLFHLSSAQNMSTSQSSYRVLPVSKFTTPTPIPPTPSPSYLPPGKQTYNISQSANTIGPRITSLTLDPLDAQKGQKQTLTIIFSGTTVLNASLTIFTDTSSYPLPLTLVNGLWSAQWTLPDTVNKRYIVVITATDPTGTAKVIVASRTTGPIKTELLLGK